MQYESTLQAMPLPQVGRETGDEQVATPALNDLTRGLRCLWISRNIPYPMDEGAKLYSGKLAESFAATGAAVRFLGFGDSAVAPHTAALPHWVSVPGTRRGKVAALFSGLPMAAAVDATKRYKELLETQLREQWDVLVLDSYGSGWALARCKAYAAARSHRPVLVHTSQNHEEVLWRSMANEAQGSFLARLALRLNAYKVRVFERRLVRQVDLLTTITAEDQHSMGSGLPEDCSLVLTPGYSGVVAGERTITPETPRRVIIVGSFRWVVKQENLRHFVKLADPIFKQHNIALDVVGEVPQPLLAELQAQCQATCFHGFVTDVAPLLARARMAVVPETIGGGFKLKLLDYIFGRVPVATLSQAAAGLPHTLREHMLVCDDLTELLAGMVRYMDRIAELNHMQQAAFAHAESNYRWDERGEQLRQAITHIRQQRATATSSA